MKPHVVAVVAIGATAVMLTAAGCGDKATSSSSSSSSTEATSSKTTSSASVTSSDAPAAEQDYSALLIPAEQIVAPGDTMTAQAPTLNPGGKPGVATVYSNADETHVIGDTILVLPDAEGASTALQGAVSAIPSAVVGGAPEPAQVGSGGTMATGLSPDGSKSVTLLVFTEGKAFVTLEFDSGPDDPVPAEFVLDVGQKQSEAIKAGLGG